MKSGALINENDLGEISGGISSRGMETVNEGEFCGEWKCNICGNSVKYSNSEVDGAPLCSHYVYLSCRSCLYYNYVNCECRKKV